MSVLTKLTYLLFIGMNLLIVILLWTSLELYDDVHYDLIENLANNWNRPLIEDVQIFNQNSCPEGLTNILEGNYFTGTDEGCYCNNTERLFRNNCHDLGLLNCTRIPKTNRSKFTLWRNRVICLKPYRILNKTMSYLDFDKLDKGQKCAGQFNKSCGYIDTLERQLCVRNESKCPLRIVQISDSVSSLANLDKIRYVSDDLVQITFDENPESTYLESSFFLSETNPCLDRRFTLLSHNYKLYSNFTLSSNETCPKREIDFLANRVDFTDYDSLININKNVLNITSTLPKFYPKEHNTSVYLWSSGYVGINDIALKLINVKYKNQESRFYDDIITDKMRLNKAYAWTITTIVTAFLSCFCFCVGLKIRHHLRKVRSVALLTLCCLLTQLFTTIVMFSNSPAVFVYNQLLNDNFSEEYNRVFSQSSLVEIENVSRLSLILFSTLLFFYSLRFIRVFACKYSQRDIYNEYYFRENNVHTNPYLNPQYDYDSSEVKKRVFFSKRGSSQQDSYNLKEVKS